MGRPYERAERDVEDFVAEFKAAARKTTVVPPSVRLWLLYIADRVARRSLVKEATAPQGEQARELGVSDRRVRQYAATATAANCVTPMGGGYRGLNVVYRLNHPSKWRKPLEKVEGIGNDETLPPFHAQKVEDGLPPLISATVPPPTIRTGLTNPSPCQTCEGTGCSTCEGTGVECA